MNEKSDSLEEDTKPFLLHRKISVKNNENIEDKYKFGDFLGSGKFGDVTKCTEIKTNYELAAKIIPIHSVDDKDLVLNEVCIMNRLRHPRLIQLYDVYVNAEKITLVMELISGGELFERIIDESFDLNEAKCAKFMKEILQGVDYIHNQKIIHLDLKPENILCLTRTGFRIKIIDFGLAKEVKEQEIRVLFGTAEFVAPEVISYDPVSYASDMWSLGVICYVLLSGLSPFMGDNEGETLSNIAKCVYSFEYSEFKEISAEAKDFIKQLLVKNPRRRNNSTQCLEHRWLSEKEKTNNCAIVNKKNLKHFVYRRKWQKAVNAIIALQRMGVCLTHKPGARKLLQHRSMKSTTTSRRSSLQSSSIEIASSVDKTNLRKSSYRTNDNPEMRPTTIANKELKQSRIINDKVETNKPPLIPRDDEKTRTKIVPNSEIGKNTESMIEPISCTLESDKTNDKSKEEESYPVRTLASTESELSANTNSAANDARGAGSDIRNIPEITTSSTSMSNASVAVFEEKTNRINLVKTVNNITAQQTCGSETIHIKSDPCGKPKSAALSMASLSKNHEGIANRIKFFSASKEAENSKLQPQNDGKKL